MIIGSIQYLRAIAALMVVVFHLLPQLERMGYVGYWPDWLAGGVDIFFVISGFIMWMTTVGRNMSPTDFFMRRIIRIVPLYWILTSVAVAVLLIAPRLLQTTTYDGWHVLSSYLFVPSQRPGFPEQINPVLHPGWTLNLEMFFYLLFGLLLLMPERSRVALMSVILAGLVAAGYLADVNGIKGGPAFLFYTNNVVLEFALGMLLAQAYRSGKIPRSQLLGWAGVLGGFLAMALLPTFLPHLPRVIILGLPALAIVAGAVAMPGTERPSHKWLLLLGDASYSIYLSHPMVLSAVGQFWRKHIGLAADGGILFGLVGVGASMAAGIIVYRVIEQPVTEWCRGRWERRRRPVGGPGRSPAQSG